ncbi:MAG TPA: 3-isopropylmalate dehydratase large subunit [Ktedonobacterales bacterium]|nr:3-isopropylmalate dehydratase large subunit [Ktedonobacterales bacterium]
MGTLTEEILSRKVGRRVHPGEIIVVDLDLVMSHDTTTPLAMEAFYGLTRPESGAAPTAAGSNTTPRSGSVFDRSRVVIAFDHIVPAATIQAATLQRDIRHFAREQGLGQVYQEGVGHQIIVEKGFVVPGDVVVGADSHTCTYGALGAFATGMGSTDIGVAYATGQTWLRVPETIAARLVGAFAPGVFAKDAILHIVGMLGADGASNYAVEFLGETVERMTQSERFTLSNMAIEMGAEVGLIAPDSTTAEYLRARTRRSFELMQPHAPEYCREIVVDVSALEPQIACPPDVDHVVPLREVAGLKVDQIFLGTCSNGRIEDLAIAAEMLRGQQVHPDTRMVVVPASREVYLEALRRGYIEIFTEAGALVEAASCGPCIGRHQGVLSAGERALTTMNRNFTGRMGDPTAEIYLGSPATIAASAITGVITDPRGVLVA